MPDAFFSSNKPRKRKRDGDGAGAPTKKYVRKEGAARPTSRDHGNGGMRGRGGALSRGRGAHSQGASSTRKTKADEELSDGSNEGQDVDDMELRALSDSDGSGDEDVDETPAEKRLRLAKVYLESVQVGLGLADGEFDAAEIDKELINARLKQDVMEHSGKVHLFVADSFELTSPPKLYTRGHRFSVTSAVASESGKWLFTAGKEGSIIKWDLRTGKKASTFSKVRPEEEDKPKSRKGKQRAVGVSHADVSGHTDEVLALAVSGDGKFLASGGKDRRVGIWDLESDKWVKGFSGHKDQISTLAFRKASLQLYSGSFDRTLKLFDLSVMGYVETLFGHQDSILSIDALRGETAVSVGGRDKTVRFWKIVDESQLVFRGGGKSAVRELLDGGGMDPDADDAEKEENEKRRGKTKRFVEGSVECVAMVDETTFLSGGDSGSICLWNTQKKKPIFTQALAHGLNDAQSSTEGVIQTPRWITALATLRYSDMFASGSWDGDVRVWKIDAKMKGFTLLGAIPALGVINSLQFVTPPKSTLDGASWAAPQATPTTEPDAMDEDTPAPAKVFRHNPVLLSIGVGQEHRLGRWLKLKGNGATNGAIVVALHQKPGSII